MVRQRAKVPAAVVAAGLVALWGCGGDVRSAERAEFGETEAAAAVAEVEPVAPLPGTREAAALAARTDVPRPSTEPVDGRDERDSHLRPRPGGDERLATVSEPERAPPVVEAGLDPIPSPDVDTHSPTDEDDTAPQLVAPEPVVEPVLLAESEPEPAPQPRGAVLPTGMRISLRLEESLSTRDHAPGDAFYAHVVDDVLDASGMVLLPLGTRVRGRVVESRSSNSAGRPAVLELAMESLIEGGRSYPLVATVVETEIDARAGESTGRTVAKIGVGVAAGAILGKLLGKDTEAAVAGAVAGGAAGTAAALSAKDGHANIPSGSTVVIRVDLPIELEPR